MYPLRDNRLLRHASATAIVAVTLLMALVTWLFYHQDHARQQTQASVMHTYEVTRHLQRLSHRVKDVSLGQRAYMITGDEKYLEAYRNALVNFNYDYTQEILPDQKLSIIDQYNAVKKLTSDNATQQENLRKLKAKIDEFLAYWAKFVPSKNGRRDTLTARETFDFNHANDVLQDMRDIFIDMQAEEKRLLGMRIAAEEQAAFTLRVVVLTSILLFYSIVIAYIFLHRRARMHAESMRNDLLKKLTETNTELERFAYVASHDMQEPLRMIGYFSKLVADEYEKDLDKEGKEYLTLISNAAMRMQVMVADLLDYARTGNDVTRFRPINVTDEMTRVADNLGNIIRETGAKITHDALPNVTGNPVQFMRLMQNLVGNGMKYQKAGTVPHVHISAEDKGSEWIFAVRDNGIGMKPEYLGKIFEPFQRLHSWQEYQGSGIGLAVCKKIVENHGGSIWASSEPGKGSTFYFSLPKKSVS
jgi:signal transduction histidine kinase